MKKKCKTGYSKSKKKDDNFSIKSEDGGRNEEYFKGDRLQSIVPNFLDLKIDQT
jgi:hypothetical protein